MTNNTWHLFSVEQPESDGVYDVRLTKKYDLLCNPVETLMEYKNGQWLMKVPAFINEYIVSAWRYR